MISFLAALTAFSSFVHEINLSQALSSALGGTIVRYQTGFGLFTCALGLGALSYDRFRLRFSALQLLLISQVLLVIGGAIGPWWIHFLSPSGYSVDMRSVLTVACYLPLVLVGFTSGLELPAILEIGSQEGRHRFRVLGWDYVGMFLGCIVYPSFFIYNLGVYGSAVFAAIVNFVSVSLTFFCFRIGRSSPPVSDEAPAVRQTHLPLVLVVGLLFLVSFCSMAYELLAAKVIAGLIQNEIQAHSLAIGLFLLGLGLGAFQSRRCVDPQKSLFRVELALTLLGALAPVILNLSAAWWTLRLNIASSSGFLLLSSVILSPLPLVIGFLSGFELPLLLQLWPGRSTVGVGLSWSYAGALVAGFVVPFGLLPAFGETKSFLVVAIANLLAAGLCLLRQKISVYAVAGFVLAGLCVPVTGQWSLWSEQLFLKANYFELRLGNFSGTALRNLNATLEAIKPIERITTLYQSIDLVERDTGARVFGKNAFTLYLNRQPQFSSSGWQTYHESFVYGATNLHGRPLTSVLILGGGDGILAGEILRQFPQAQVTMVELDAGVLNLSKQHPEILKVNRASLTSPQLDIVVDDAFTFVHQSGRKFESVFIDFPYPVSFELSRLYSVEFYAALRQRIEPGGFLVMDAPIWFELDEAVLSPYKPHLVLLDTLAAAGFNRVLTFGPIEPFLFARVGGEALAFNYASFPRDLSNPTFVNLTPIDHLTRPSDGQGQFVNSVFKPQRFME